MINASHQLTVNRKKFKIPKITHFVLLRIPCPKQETPNTVLKGRYSQQTKLAILFYANFTSSGIVLTGLL